jgi:hypothetical protein
MTQIRYERTHNGHMRPVEWRGRQPIRHETIPPTRWTVLVHDPDRWEGCEVHHFDSREAREQWIEQAERQGD